MKLALKESENYHNRILFLDVVENILAMSSKKYFRDLLFYNYLEMAHDPVPNIRLRFVTLLPKVRKTLRLPIDTSLLQKLTDATEPLLTRDLDRDVVQATGEAFAELGLFGYGPDESGLLIPFHSENELKRSLSKHSLESTTDEYLLGSNMGFHDDVTDKQREEEEHAILILEWEVDGSSRRKLSDKGKLLAMTKGLKSEPSRRPTITSKKKLKDQSQEFTPTSSKASFSSNTKSAPSTAASLSKTTGKPSGGTRSGPNSASNSPSMVKKRTVSASTSKSSNFKSGSVTPKSNMSPRVLHSPRDSASEPPADVYSRHAALRNGSAPASRVSSSHSSYNPEKGGDVVNGLSHLLSNISVGSTTKKPSRLNATK